MQTKRRSNGKLPKGITERHSRLCAISAGGKRCSCEPSYVAQVSDKRTRKRYRETFARPKYADPLAAAQLWREKKLLAIKEGEHVTEASLSLRAAAEEWLAGVNADRIRQKGGAPYKPSVVRTYELNLRLHVLPELGGKRLREITYGDLMALAEGLRGQGLAPGTIRNIINPVRAIYGREIELGRVRANPTVGLRLPSGTVSPRERAASPEEARELLAALSDRLRPIYATAFYAGLRRGELRGLRWGDVDLARGKIHVRRSWDDQAGAVEPKSKRGTRNVPILGLLRDELVAHKARSRGREADFVFPGRQPDQPFTSTAIRKAALKAWAAENERREEAATEEGVEPKLLEPIQLHECRHTMASLFLAAGEQMHKLSRYIGHASVTTTVDLYGHLLEGAEEESRALVDAYLARSDTAGRIEQIEEGADRDEL